MILVVTGRQDETANRVVAALNRMGYAWARLNREAYPESASAAFDPARPQESFLLDEDGDRIPLASLDSLWLWHPPRFDLVAGLTPGQARFTGEACLMAYRSLMAYLHESCFVVNPMDREERANDKALQLRVALSLGFRIPETLITNAPEEARAFCARFPEAIFKTVNRSKVEGEEEVRWISTEVLTPDDLAALGGLRHCPGIFQRRIPKRCDLRVTVVGEAVFPVEIHSQGHAETAVDFRLAWSQGIELPHRVHELPDSVAAQCLALARRLGLVYCALDLVITPGGEYVFLEVNPSGQFGWIEHATGLPITRSLARLLGKTHM